MKKPLIIRKIGSRIPEHFHWPMWVVVWLVGVTLGVLLVVYLEGREQSIVDFFENNDIYYSGMDFLVGILTAVVLISGIQLFLPAFLFIWAVIFSIFKSKGR